MAAIATTPVNWELTAGRRTPLLGPVLRVGARAIPIADIQGYVASSDGGRDPNPAVATIIVFGIVAVFFLIGWLDLGWRQRFLAAAVLFGLIAVSALHDMAWQTSSTIHRVDILTRAGETVRFATVNAAEQAALVDALSAVVVKTSLVAANDDGALRA